MPPTDPHTTGALLSILALLMALGGLIVIVLLFRAWRRFNDRQRRPNHRHPSRAAADPWQASGTRLVARLDQQPVTGPREATDQVHPDDLPDDPDLDRPAEPDPSDPSDPDDDFDPDDYDPRRDIDPGAPDDPDDPDDPDRPEPPDGRSRPDPPDSTDDDDPPEPPRRRPPE